MIAMILLAVSASAADCVPTFYKSLPRDGTWRYAVGAGPDASAARAAAVSQLDSEDWEQDDYRECRGVSYVMVRATLKPAVKASVIESMLSRIARRIEDVVGYSAGHDAKLDRIERRLEAMPAIQKGPIVIHVDRDERTTQPIQPYAMAIDKEQLAPRVKASLAKIDGGDFKTEDVAVVVASYNTMHDADSLRKFCDGILKKDLGFQRGLREWTISQCAKGAY